MTEINDTFTEQKNLKENSPIMLYRITIPDVDILRATEWDVDVEYDGDPYLACEIKHEGISRNILGEIDSVKVTWSNINRQIGALLLYYNGLRGYQVDMILVFADMLDDPDANITETFWVDSSSITDMVATFTLTTRLDLYQAKLPCRIMNRDFCSWIFKRRGCYITGEENYEAPAGFLHADVTCDHTLDGVRGCRYHCNSRRFGGSPSIPQKSVWVI